MARGCAGAWRPLVPRRTHHLAPGDTAWARPKLSPGVHLDPQPPNHVSPHSYANVYRELEQTIRMSDAQEDLRWFRSTSGPGMPMNWPQFEVRLSALAGCWQPCGAARRSGVVPLCLQEWNPDLTHTITRKEKQKKGEGVALTNASGAGDTGAQAGERGR